MANTVSRSWFAVLPHPEKYYQGSPEEIVEEMKNEWIGENPLRKGHWAYCISKDGLPHIHAVLENSVSMRFSAVKKVYSKVNMHLEETKASKKQVLAYIHKKPPFDEKGEQVICFTSYGNIEGNKRFRLSNMNETMDKIEELIEDGMTPAQIMAEDIRLRKEETLIRKAYFAKRYRETPPHRKVTVYWHCGMSGVGKSYTYIELCDRYGEDDVYFFSDYTNKGVGGMDNYCGENILFLDELKKGSLPYEMLLLITQGYRSQIHCRYANAYALWTEVHITSIYPPEEIYKSVVNDEDREIDTVKQLLRRINTFIYHYKDGEEYKSFELDGKEYVNYEELKYLALEKDGFCEISGSDNPFREDVEHENK